MKKISKIFLTIVFGILFHGCSWFHKIQIKNTTNSTWKIKYEINDERGVFKNHVHIKIGRKKEGQTLEFKNYEIEFLLQPNETASIGYARNSHYNGYKNFFKFDKEMPWKSFINANILAISNDKKNYEIEFSKLNNVLDKNKNQLARINILKLIEMNERKKP